MYTHSAPIRPEKSPWLLVTEQTAENSKTINTETETESSCPAGFGPGAGEKSQNRHGDERPGPAGSGAILVLGACVRLWEGYRVGSCLPALLPAWLPCLAVPRLASPRLASPCLASPCLASPRLALPCLASPRLASPRLALPCLALPCLALPCLALLALPACLPACLELLANIPGLLLVSGKTCRLIGKQHRLYGQKKPLTKFS